MNFASINTCVYNNVVVNCASHSADVEPANLTGFNRRPIKDWGDELRPRDESYCSCCLDTDSTSTLVHAFVSLRVDHCNAVLIVRRPKSDEFGRGLSRLLHTELHWLNVPQRVAFKLGLMVFNCLHNQAPQYLVDLCQSVCSVASRQHLRSASRSLLVVPRHHISSYGRQAFSVAGSAIWNWLPDSLTDPVISRDFKCSLKTFLFFSLLLYVAH